MVKKEISHILGRDVIYEALEEIRGTKEILIDLSEKSKLLDAALSQIDSKLDKMEKRIEQLEDQSREFISCENISLLKKKDKISILVFGFYGARNVGDELMLNAVLRGLDFEKYDITIMLSNNYDFDASFYSPCKVIHFPKNSSDYASLAGKYDLIIWGGGALLDDREYCFRGMYTSLSYISIAVTKAIIAGGGKFAAFGVSSNSNLQDRKYIKDLKYLVDNSIYFSLRDDYSRKVLEDNGIDDKRLKFIDDLSVSSYVNCKIDSKIGAKENVLGLNFIVSDELVDEYVRIVQDLITQYDDIEVVKFLPFYDYKNNDVRFYGIIIDKLVSSGYNSVKYEICEFADNCEKLITEMRECGKLLLMRYHAVLMGVLSGCNIAMLDYSGSHPHYWNKNRFIRDHYAPDLKVYNFKEIVNGKSTKIYFSKNALKDDVVKEMSIRIDSEIKKVVRMLEKNEN